MKRFFSLFLIVFFLQPVFGQDGGTESADTGSASAVDGTGSGAVNGGGIVTEQDSVADDLEKTVEKAIEETIEDAAEARGKFFSKSNYTFFVRLGIAAGIFILQIVLIWLTFRLAAFVTKHVNDYGLAHFRPIKFKKIVLMEVDQMLKFSARLIFIIKLLFTLLQLAVTIPIIFHFFEPTRNIATKLFGYIFNPLKRFFFGLINYIPNLFAIAVILIIARYILHGLRFFTLQIERKKLVVSGFYPDWAKPTFNILRVLVYAFTIAFIYPYLPNSESDIFKGISVLVGVIFSLGSSSVISNLIAGIVMTYMRPFRIGDRIKIDDITGFVVERGPMNTRIRTHKNEFVSFPNQMILNKSVTNYNSSTEGGLDGYIVHAAITMGYDVSWRTVHDILINAALKTAHTENTPAPFVNQTKLDDFYCWYEINVFTKNVSLLPSIYTELYKNIQDGFADANISMFAPHYGVYTDSGRGQNRKP
ncbi:MAG: mechanosensitive ion channel family protein [Spirochaetaceae bacterium]|jgi:small-conductance mechanosensitive channel|nr:mechanosensitive ion channel family protein [Spirochaetaceae bacterium]